MKSERRQFKGIDISSRTEDIMATSSLSTAPLSCASTALHSAMRAGPCCILSDNGNSIRSRIAFTDDHSHHSHPKIASISLLCLFLLDKSSSSKSVHRRATTAENLNKLYAKVGYWNIRRLQ